MMQQNQTHATENQLMQVMVLKLKPLAAEMDRTPQLL